MKYGPICLVLCAIGVGIVAAGAVWRTSFANQAVWTEEQALKFNEVSATFHAAAHNAAGAHHDHAGHEHGAAVSSGESELAAAKAAWQAEMTRRDDAIARRTFWSYLIFGIGMTGIVLGGGGYLVVQNVLEEE